ncbi:MULTISPECIES: (2Fe-2S)-binding protein [Actinoalloteichus]|uniref:Ferric iron reductase FhuF-like transporter/FhuF 2Fe-2S C-terminal domain n=1 Tax=Actinoalloteichus fjordicus TaxID=1612552 RepID=A0AAC9LGK2_9PSEU|nr:MULTISPECIES: (2Fe-2S)-binding protein [Actinoalloteichus]APU15899.1 Ferric iron reductase FhuF-like transporter/FhuF 2Fe-2S C-terminal domain [Actinoalloteichus fjordicus]APU21961.1 Ferric iron reductase FhuF-like transporter/FhuF 2Fe-2S C-terminal domain [Actinoalloteichus sp. GBA129-24]
MTTHEDQQAPLDAVVLACRDLTFAPLPELRPDRPAPMEGETRWLSLVELLDDGRLAETFDALRAREGAGHPGAAAIRYLKGLLRETVFLVSASIYLTDRAPELSPETLWFPFAPDGDIGTPRITSRRAAVLRGDPDARLPDTVVVADRDALDVWAAARLVEVFGPLVEQVRRHSRVGARTLWGYLVDILHFYMINPARRLDRNVPAAFARADRLVAAVIAAGAPVKARPRLFRFRPEGNQGVWAVRSTCCFDYKVDAEHGYCGTCPLQEDTVRAAQFDRSFSR